MADFTTADAIDAILKLYAAQQSQGKFRQVPQSPEQTALLRKMLGFIDNSPTRNAMGNVIGQWGQGKRVSTFDLPTSPGYQAGQPPQSIGAYNPNQRPGGLDLSVLLSNYGKGMNNSVPSGGGGLSTPSGAAGGQPGYGTPGYASPFDTMGSNPDAHNVTMDDVKKYGPQVAGLVAMLAGVGMPVAMALKLALSKMGGQQPEALTNQPNQFGNWNVKPGDMTPGMGEGELPNQPNYMGGKQWTPADLAPGQPGDWTKKYYDPMGGASGIGSLLSGQMGDSANGPSHHPKF